MFADQFALNATGAEPAPASREDELLLLIKGFLSRRGCGSPAMSFQAIETLRLVAPPEPKGGPRNAAAETGEAGVLCFLVELNAAKPKGNLLIQLISLALKGCL